MEKFMRKDLKISNYYDSTLIPVYMTADDVLIDDPMWWSGFVTTYNKLRAILHYLIACSMLLQSHNITSEGSSYIHIQKDTRCNRKKQLFRFKLR